MIKEILMVAAGGAVGSVFRYLMSKAVQDTFLPTLPWGTMIVNVLGCLLIGIVTGGVATGAYISNEMKLLLTTGFCGGFTTFSTFMNEGCLLIKGDNIIGCAIYIGMSITFGLLAAAGGIQLGKMI